MSTSSANATGRVAGKVAIVTGGARGQGESHAELLAREGASVLLTDVLDEEGEAVAARLTGEGLQAAYRRLDVADAAQWDAAVAAAEEQFGPVTVLVNNAGVGSKSGIETCTDEEWARVVGICQTGVFYGMRAVAPSMKGAKTGSIINISSQWAHTGGEADYAVAYVAAKAAVLGLTRNAALTLGPHGIRANSISPGMIDTAMLGNPAYVLPWIERAPLRRAGQPHEVSHAVLYLASDESGYTTGTDLMIDGGLEVI